MLHLIHNMLWFYRSDSFLKVFWLVPVFPGKLNRWRVRTTMEAAQLMPQRIQRKDQITIIQPSPILCLFDFVWAYMPAQQAAYLWDSNSDCNAIIYFSTVRDLEPHLVLQYRYRTQESKCTEIWIPIRIFWASLFWGTYFILC